MSLRLRSSFSSRLDSHEIEHLMPIQEDLHDIQSPICVGFVHSCRFAGRLGNIGVLRHNLPMLAHQYYLEIRRWSSVRTSQGALCSPYQISYRTCYYQYRAQHCITHTADADGMDFAHVTAAENCIEWSLRTRVCVSISQNILAEVSH